MSMLEIKNISKSFRDGSEENHVLSGLSLSVESGEIVAVLGPSGSGKSTFLSIAGLLLSAEKKCRNFRNRNGPDTEKSISVLFFKVTSFCRI